MRHRASGLRQAMRRRELCLGQPIEPPPGPHQKSLILHAPKINAWHADGFEVACARYALLTDEGERTTLRRSFGRHGACYYSSAYINKCLDIVTAQGKPSDVPQLHARWSSGQIEPGAARR